MLNTRITILITISVGTLLLACHSTKPVAKADDKAAPTTVAAGATASVTTTTVAVTPPAETGKPYMDTFATLPSGLQYRIYHHGTGTRKGELNDRLEFHLTIKIDDSLVFDTHAMNKNVPVSLMIAKPKFPGDPVEGYMQMVGGDSAVFKLPIDTLLKYGSNMGNKMPDWMVPGKRLTYSVNMLSVRTPEEFKRDADFKIQHQKYADDSLLQDYFAKNNLKPESTPSGLYYIIQDSGKGELPNKGEIMSVFYAGKFLNGNIFDTNEDSTFHHQDPMRVELGKGHVMKGWDEGLAFLRKGAKATLFIPSGLAYGPRDRGVIPGNSVLMFDISVVNIQSADAVDEELLQNYFKTNHIKALKAESGLYYTINKPGKGAVIKSGQTASVYYTGKLLDGTVFDTNTDTTFHHTDPFKFEVGKGRVISGWDQGVTLLNKGAKATLYLPSRLGYGSRGQGKKIPPNSILIFDVELLDISNEATAPPRPSKSKPAVKK
jgi:FKBP-type peptidyl-prolyl cis-trans isomerase